MTEPSGTSAAEGLPVEEKGVPIVIRVRPRPKLPQGVVQVKHLNRQFRINFDKLPEIPEADPPPPTAEELAALEEERNRVASPLYYGRAQYQKRSLTKSASTVSFQMPSAPSFGDFDETLASPMKKGAMYPEKGNPLDDDDEEDDDEAGVMSTQASQLFLDTAVVPLQTLEYKRFAQRSSSCVSLLQASTRTYKDDEENYYENSAYF
ncbi:hypothetical protein AGDE_15835 [Angomonas deanei]|uniref:Uncharacterized protein n=1 Tax=Angomonas deanei TaxID=59799 RepID=A0A7G2C1P0_9TRYP|nr:hypothetical protein AGDE_15835 [Angomonas deanei]CAD2213688.1 hypothetical protein, conserved [Angomonas deanei]|eukprot:EPY18291.1 hypothetical protein AGDE_15835 [Angomonas deanei]